MRLRSLVRLAPAILAVLWALSGTVAAASAAPVLVVGAGGHTVVRNDRSLPSDAATPPPTTAAQATPRSSRAPVRAARASQTTVLSVLSRLRKSGQITASAYETDRTAFADALQEVRQLSSARATELDAVVELLHGMAVRGTLTASRLPVLFLTLDRNREYWRSGPLLSYGQRVEFAGSQIVWEYYPGQGIQLQQLGSFGKADWYCRAGRAYTGDCRAALSELIPLAVMRGGGLAWEYYFGFDGGVPPWTSAMAQGTALAALADGARDLHDRSYLTTAHDALPLFNRQPPTGVGVKTRVGMRFVQYSFAPARDDEVINAFLQTLIGLHDYARTSHDPVAQQLFAAGDAEAQAELPSFNTGAWSLYQPGEEDSLSYHELVTGFLQRLCSSLKTPLYCQTAADFRQDLKTPPALSLLTPRVGAKRATDLYFTVSKISHVGITIRRNGATLFLTSAEFPYGQHDFAIPALRAGTYSVTLAATDLAGNYGRTSATLHVSK